MRRLVSRLTLLILGLAPGGATLCLADTTPIHVVLEGASVSGADVFVDAQHRGKTDAMGILDVDRALLQNNETVLSARLQVYEVPAFLLGREDALSPAGWVMRAYVTSVVINDSGSVKLAVVTDKTIQQELVLKRDNVLIGLQVLASTDWDMSPVDFSRLMETFQMASRFLWNATDGQFILERVKIADQTGDWDRSEFRLWADNTLRPRANKGGYLTQNLLGQIVGTYITLPWRDPKIHKQGPNGPWAGNDPRTFIHEFGHMGLSLNDEYSDLIEDTCTVRRSTDIMATPFRANGEKAACIMDNQFVTSKFCSDQAPNSHNYTSQQPDDCWAGIRGGYSDPQGVRWVLKTPVTRNQIVGTLRGASGTPKDAFPLEWNTGFVATNEGWHTDLCKPFLQTVTDVNGSTVGAAPVKLVYTSTDPSERTYISEGKTWPGGQIAILGAHQGDTVRTETASIALAICPEGASPQGPLGIIDTDSDGDHVLDGFDNCPDLFNPYDFDGVSWVAQTGTGCACAASSDCSDGLVCADAGGGAGLRCIIPTCRNDTDCGSGRRCKGSGSGAVCVDTFGTRCASHAQCGSGRCDIGDGSSRTGVCVPTSFAGQPGAVCSQDNQCVFANCSGLAPDGVGGWRTGQCGATATKRLGEHCFNHPQCASGYCDAGDGTSKTNLCMPANDGLAGDLCSHDNQCTSRNCGGLAPHAAGGWQPGHCSADHKKPLGDYCFGHDQCDSAYCDAGLGTSQTNRCMPNKDGQFGQICSHDNQCASLNCSGLSNRGALVPGTCGIKKALGVACSANAQCNSAYCDGGIGTSQTYRCMPNMNGQIGEICSNDNQCSSSVCAGLTKDAVGQWVPGLCASKRALGDSCLQHHQCGSGYCDSGNNTSRTDRCMPNNNGRTGEICSHHNQCTSRVCDGLHAQGNNWVPGQCR